MSEGAGGEPAEFGDLQGKLRATPVDRMSEGGPFVTGLSLRMTKVLSVSASHMLQFSTATQLHGKSIGPMGRPRDVANATASLIEMSNESQRGVTWKSTGDVSFQAAQKMTLPRMRTQSMVSYGFQSRARLAKGGTIRTSFSPQLGVSSTLRTRGRPRVSFQMQMQALSAPLLSSELALGVALTPMRHAKIGVQAMFAPMAMQQGASPVMFDALAQWKRGGHYAGAMLGGLAPPFMPSAMPPQWALMYMRSVGKQFKLGARLVGQGVPKDPQGVQSEVFAKVQGQNVALGVSVSSEGDVKAVTQFNAGAAPTGGATFSFNATTMYSPSSGGSTNALSLGLNF
ncbi:MAG: hypothetical protein MHM6MM_000322 [Cercozoa sp. M6MM]